MGLWVSRAPSPLSGKEASAAVRRLLRHAFRNEYRCDAPPLLRSENGKPYFADKGAPFVSLSHSGDTLLCALFDSPCGCDVQIRRKVSPRLAETLTEREKELFDFFEVWVLRESLFKTLGEGDLRRSDFWRAGGLVLCPEDQMRLRLYDLGPDCAAAVCLRGEEPPETLTRVDWEALQRP